MGEWRKDQSKNARRYLWGQTRGEHDATRRDFLVRMKPFPVLGKLQIEKIGGEIHAWREVTEDSGKRYWTSCLRFIDDGYGFWTLFYRPDERRWRSTPYKDLPVGRVIAAAAEFFGQNFETN
jgi:hypothetical protein